VLSRLQSAGSPVEPVASSDVISAGKD
jgi:hypothetical protein